MDGGVVKVAWNIVLSGYPSAGKTIPAKRLVSENKSFAAVGVEELRTIASVAKIYLEKFQCG